MTIAPFCMHDMSKCSLRDALHFVPLCHSCLSSSWCHFHWCKSAIWCLLLLLIRTWCFVIFVAIDVCILWVWALHVFWSMPCHLYSGVCHVFLWSMWWLAQACKLGFVMFLFSGTWFSPSLLLLLFCCYVSIWLQRDPCSFWRFSVRMFCRYSCAPSIHAPVCNYVVP